ncbi:MAG: hypothetical protein RL702_155 [Pseudomonadota bacterium]
MGQNDEMKAFRQEVRDFLRDNIPADLTERVREDFDLTREDMQRWNAILHKQGWSVPNWPVEFGGPGWSPIQRHIFAEECGRADAPAISGFGHALVGPIIYTFGSDYLKERYLPGIRSGEEFWCQGFSEPNAGSDLLALTTRATDCGDHWLVEGRKIWTTLAHYADHMFALVRSEPGSKGANGLTLLVIDMRDPGVEVRPIVTIDRAHHTCEVLLNGVRVPKTEQIGEAGKAWDYARALLQNERATSAHLPRAARHLRRLDRAARVEGPDGQRAIDDPLFVAEMADAIIDYKALQVAVMRVIGEAPEEEKRLLASVIKLRGSELAQTLTKLTARALGHRALRYWPDPSWPASYDTGIPDEFDEVGTMANLLLLRAATIYGGSSEVQRNLIARITLK